MEWQIIFIFGFLIGWFLRLITMIIISKLNKKQTQDCPKTKGDKE